MCVCRESFSDFDGDEKVIKRKRKLFEKATKNEGKFKKIHIHT